jgi:ABC-type uncharacterized transport system involved in gliding motility auxiliary subunit
MSDDKNTTTAKRAMPKDARLAQPQGITPKGLASLACWGLGSLLLIIGLLWWAVRKVFVPGPMVLVVLGGLLIVAAVALNFQAIVATLRQRRALSGLNTAAFAALVFGILVLLNIVAVRHHARWDATKSKQYSLSEQTVKILKSLNQDVHIVAFIPPDDPDQEKVRDRIKEYQVRSTRIKVETYDPMTDIQKVREYNVPPGGGTVIYVKCGDKKEEVIGAEEERLTSAILAVTTGQKPKIYFLTGHGEFDPTEYGQDSVNAIQKSLETQQYAVETLTLINKPNPAIPHDAAAVVIAGAQSPLKPAEMEALKKYADQGGKLFIALSNAPQAPDFSEILKPRGVTPLKGQIMDPNAEHNGGQPEIPYVLKPEPHDITRRLQPVALPLAMALKVEEGPEPPPSYPGAPPPPPSKKAAELLKTSAEAWLDKADAAGKFNRTKDAGEETGPLVMAAAIDESKKNQEQEPGMPPAQEQAGPGTRIVVVGNAEFMTDRFILANQLRGNLDLVLKSIAWLTQNEKLISIPPKEEETPYLTMIGAQKALATIIALFIVPGLVVFAGGLVWWRRRR